MNFRADRQAMNSGAEVNMMAERQDHQEGTPAGEGDGNLVGFAAVRYTAYVVIVLAVLYFAARYVMPLFYR